MQKFIKILLTLSMCLVFAGIAFGQYRSSPIDAQLVVENLNDNISDAEIVSFQEARDGPGDIYLLYSLYSNEATLIDNRIIPVVVLGKEITLLDQLLLKPTITRLENTWSGFPEYGSEIASPFINSFEVMGDHKLRLTAKEASPNLNIRLDNGNIAALNLIYIEGVEISLVAHTELSMGLVIDETATSLATTEQLQNWYRPDESYFILKSHFDLTEEGKVGLLSEARIWGRSSEGLFWSDPEEAENTRKFVGYNRIENYSLALEEKGLSSSCLNALVYSSPFFLKSAHLENLDGLDFNINSNIWLSKALFKGGAPVVNDEPYAFHIQSTIDKHEISVTFIRSKIRAFACKRDVGPEARAILGLSSDSKDTDRDGLPDYLEIMMNSDPTDPYTEGEEFNDRELYLEMGMLPPLTRRDFPEEMIAPEPKVYPFDGTPSTTIRPLTKKRGAPMQFKYEMLVSEDRFDEAAEVKERFLNMYVYNMYGEEAMIDYHNNRDRIRLMRFHQPWDTLLYGSLDSDRDGIPDGLEASGELFGGPNYSNYGVHYWEEDGRLQWAFLMGRPIDGLYIDRFIDTTYAAWGFILIMTEWELDTILGVDGWDTDMDGLDDYSEYLWHSCPLLDYSDPSPGALKDHHKVQHQFVAPRPDWITDFQDWDSDGIPNGAELYYMPELGYGVLDPYCGSSDYDQYDDRLEWMSWQYKYCEMCEYPLDDPLPYVIRNGCHPLLPAYPVIFYVQTSSIVFLPHSDVITTSRGIAGASGMSAELSASLEEAVKLSVNPLECEASFTTKGEQTLKSTWSLTTSWDMAISAAYDFSTANVITCFRLANIGTEPFDYNPSPENYFNLMFDIYMPGDPSTPFALRQVITGVDGLVPYRFDEYEGDTISEGGSGGTEELPDYVDKCFENHLNEWLGLEWSHEDSSNITWNFDQVNYMWTGCNIAHVVQAAVYLYQPSYGVPLGLITLGGEIAAGLILQENFYGDDIYRKFIDDFALNKRLTYRPRQSPTYNTGADGVFTCDNLCDWTSIQAAHRNYVTIMLQYPGPTVYGNILRESPINNITGSDTTYYTLEEFWNLYAGRKIEQVFWNEGDSLERVGCYPNVPYGATVPNPCFPSEPESAFTSFGGWIITTSIDTITNPSRKADLCRAGNHRFIGRTTAIKPGDVFIINYLNDSDNDSLMNSYEYIYGTNPYNPDTDYDKLRDGSEIKLGLDPLNPNSDNSYYDALDGDEVHFLRNMGHLLPVELFEGDTIFPNYASWDSYLEHSPRTYNIGGTFHNDFVPWPYNSGGYNSKLDDQYMDANLNGLADWVERYFRDPNVYWNGMFRVTWDGWETRFNPFGYRDYVLETRRVSVDTTFNHVCDTFTLATGNRVLEIICNDLSGAGSSIWENSYIYFKLFNCNIPVTDYLEISYDLWPVTANGKNICIDLIFNDQKRAITDTLFVDVNGDRMHPAWRPYGVPEDEFHRVTASLAPFEGKTIIAIAIGYEDAPNDMSGRVHAYIDNLSIRNKNIILDFEPKNAPPSGFLNDEILGDIIGFKGWNGVGGAPHCTLSYLPSPDPSFVTGISIDTMIYGPRERVYEINGYLDPFELPSGEPWEWGFTFACMKESLEYRIDENTTLGYYIWQEYSPSLHSQREDLPGLIPPKVVVDLLIENPETHEIEVMLDYLREENIGMTDQFGNSLIPIYRNEIDSEDDLTWRPVSGDFWRYIDVPLPDELSGWLIQKVLIRYQTDLPCIGNLRAYLDQVALFERKTSFYEYPYHTSFGDPLASEYDNNLDEVVDWEEINIHKVRNIYSNYAKKTYASLLYSNDLGPWSYELSGGDTLWRWFVIDAATGDTSYSWFVEFAMLPDSSFKYANTGIAAGDSYTTLIDVENFMTAVWEDPDPRLIFGYMSNVPGDIVNIYDPLIIGRREIDGDNGLLRIERTEGSSTRDSTLLFEVYQTPPCTLCTKHCLFLMFRAWRETGSFRLGYKLSGLTGIHWFDWITNTSPYDFRYPVPNTFSSADSVRRVESVWMDTRWLLKGYLDNFTLRRVYYRSFEPAEPDDFVPNDLVMNENISLSVDECDIYHIDDADPLAPSPTQGDYFLVVSGTMLGYSPARFRYNIFEFPFPTELELTDKSSINFNIAYNFDPPVGLGNAIIDLELELASGDTVYLHEYMLPDNNGEIYTPHLRVDALGRWQNVSVDLSGLPDDTKITKISVLFRKPAVVSSIDYEIYIDEILIAF
ncbi:hypothetical protein JXI42_06675 [bacterium]|nr:hypothetical protein [bacterium]